MLVEQPAIPASMAEMTRKSVPCPAHSPDPKPGVPFGSPCPGSKVKHGVQTHPQRLRRLTSSGLFGELGRVLRRACFSLLLGRRWPPSSARRSALTQPRTGSSLCGRPQFAPPDPGPKEILLIFRGPGTSSGKRLRKLRCTSVCVCPRGPRAVKSAVPPREGTTA